jgi:ATP phosphoribosyltransferase regulatory subunit
MAPRLIRRRAPSSIRPWPGRVGNRGSGANIAFTLPREKGCALEAALLKGALETCEGHPVTPIVEAPTFANSLSQAPRSAGERALDCFLAAGFERTEPPILHPAAIFLDMSGEEVRRRLFLTADAAGEELCLRPEYTIPVCRAYLASDKAGGVAEFSYLGPVFRARAGHAGEQTQTGLESFGRKDGEAADAEVFALGLEAATAAGGGALATRLGDAGLFEGALDSLAIPEAWRRRLRRGVARGRSLDAIFNRPSPGALAQAGVLAALESADHAGAKALVEDLLAIAGIEAVGGRSAGEIADRFLEQASLRAGEPIEAEKRAVLEAFLAISGDPDEAAVELRRLADSAGLDLGVALDAFELRNGFIAARGARIEDIRFSAAFVRDFDYYTGFVFEAHDPAAPGARTALAGGRYDGLARRLGAPSDIPAVGAAITLDRLTNGGER